MNFKAFIFDLDGVIVDTAKYHYLAWRRLAEELGFEFTEEHNERLKGVSRVRSLEILLEIGNKTLTKEEMTSYATKKNEWYVDYIIKMTPEEILPGAIELLKYLKENGLGVALASASKNAPLILERLNITEYFDAIVDGNRVSKTKPDPEVFLKAAKELNASISECIVFEDAVAGVEAAKNAEMYCVGIGNKTVLNKADMVIDGLHAFQLDMLK